MPLTRYSSDRTRPRCGARQRARRVEVLGLVHQRAGLAGQGPDLLAQLRRVLAARVVHDLAQLLALLGRRGDDGRHVVEVRGVGVLELAALAVADDEDDHQDQDRREDDGEQQGARAGWLQDGGAAAPRDPPRPPRTAGASAGAAPDGPRRARSATTATSADGGDRGAGSSSRSSKPRSSSRGAAGPSACSSAGPRRCPRVGVGVLGSRAAAARSAAGRPCRRPAARPTGRRSARPLVVELGHALPAGRSSGDVDPHRAQGTGWEVGEGGLEPPSSCEH